MLPDGIILKAQKGRGEVDFIFLSDGNSLGRGFESGHFTSPKVVHTFHNLNTNGPLTILTF